MKEVWVSNQKRNSSNSNTHTYQHWQWSTTCLCCFKPTQARPPVNRRGCFWFDYSLCIYLHLARSTFVQGKRNFAHAQAHTKMDCKRFVKHDFPYTATWQYCLPAVVFFFLSFMLCTISVRASVCVCAQVQCTKSLSTMKTKCTRCVRQTATIWTKYRKTDWFFHMRTRKMYRHLTFCNIFFSSTKTQQTPFNITNRLWIPDEWKIGILHVWKACGCRF